jgi:hypothetical protein
MTTATASIIPARPQRQASSHTADSIRDDVLLGLQTFDDSFLQALAGDFLADADEQQLRERYCNRPATLRLMQLKNQRTRAAQRALHGLYNKLNARLPLTAEELALAEHARDLCQGYAQGEIERRCCAAGL